MNSNLPFQSNITKSPHASKENNILPSSFVSKQSPHIRQIKDNHVGVTSYNHQAMNYSFTGKGRPTKTLSFHIPQRSSKSPVEQIAINIPRVLEENERQLTQQLQQLFQYRQKEANSRVESNNNSLANSRKMQSIVQPLWFCDVQKSKEVKSVLHKTAELGSKIPAFVKRKNMKNEQPSYLAVPLNNSKENICRQSKTDRQMRSRKQNRAATHFDLPNNLKLRHQLSDKEPRLLHKELNQLESAQKTQKEISATKLKESEIEEVNFMVNTNDQSIQSSFLDQKQAFLPLFQQFHRTQKEQNQPDIKIVIRRQAKKTSNFQFFKNIKKKKLSWHSKNSFVLSDFDIIDKIGKGAFGDVFAAQQKASGFICVLKKLSKKKLKELKLEQQILRQIKIQSYLNHRHLTPLYGFFDDEKDIYLILQLLPDGSLSKHKRKIPENQTSAYIKQISLGLKYMHAQNVIHRDIKPQNIFLNEGFAKIGDFGCSIYTNTYRNSQIGSLAYISPEQLKLQKYNQKIDIWSLGVVAYEMLLGVSPFENEIIKIAKKEIPPQLSELTFPNGTMLSSQAKNFLMGMLNNDPQSRFVIQEALQHQFIQKHNKLEDIKLQKMRC